MFLLTLEQAAMLLLFILLGYLLRKTNVLKDSAKATLSVLLLNFFSPFYSMDTLSKQVSVEKIVEYATYLLAGTLVTLLLIAISIPLAKSLAKDRLHQNMLKYALSFGNIGYFGYPVVGAVFGELTKANMMLFCLPMTVAIYTYGYVVLTEKIEGGVVIKSQRSTAQKLRFLYSAPFLGMVAGIVLGLLPIEIPSFINNIFALGGSGYSVTAMLLTGVVLAKIPFIKLFTSLKPYLIGLIRMLLIPFIVIAVFLLLNLCGLNGQMFKDIAMISIVTSAMPVGMNVVVFPEANGMDSTEGSKMCFLSYVMALAILPLVFELMLKVIENFA